MGEQNSRSRTNGEAEHPVKDSYVRNHIAAEMEWQETHHYLDGISEEQREATRREWDVSEKHGRSHEHLMGRVGASVYDEAKEWDAPHTFDPRAVKLARAALEESRTSLMMAFRYLDRALWKMPLETAQVKAPLGTDGTTLYFNPLLVIERYRTGSHELARDYLHAVLHCVFRHPFPTMRDYVDHWKTTCDVIVESVALEMCAGRFACAQDARRRELVDAVRARLGGIVPSKLYRALQRAQDKYFEPGPEDLTHMEALELAALFARDDAAPWDLKNEVVADSYDTERPEGTRADAPHDEDTVDVLGNASQEDETAPIPQDAEGQDGALEDANGAASDGRDAGPAAGEEPSHRPAPDPGESQDQDARPEDLEQVPEVDPDAQRTLEEWSDIAQRIEVDLRTMAKARGLQAELFVTNLTLANRRRIDYADFLRRFSTVAEDMRANPDEFDYIFYTYGLELYGNMPLVEPLEYIEHNRVREFVIAIDTSGSCAGELVRTFVTRTFEILKEGELFGDAVNVHIVQCDAQVQHDTVVETLDDVRLYLDEFRVYGMGGTDFRPVFDYVGELLAQGEFADLRGLVYFTDGLGIYPTAAPPYDTAFVFVEDEGEMRLVPPWAMKVVLGEDQIMQLNG